MPDPPRRSDRPPGGPTAKQSLERLRDDHRGGGLPHPGTLGPAIAEVIRLRGIVQTRGHAELKTAWQAAAEPILGSAIAAQTEPVAIKRGTLEIAAPSAAIKARIEGFHKAELLANFQKEQPRQGVKAIKVVLRGR